MTVTRSVTDEELLTLDGISHRTATLRFDVLNQALETIGTVKPVSAPTVEQNINRAIKRTLNGFRLDPDTRGDVNTLTDRIRPVYVLESGTTYELGVFLFAEATRPRRPWGVELDASLYDLLWLFDQEIAESVSYPAGTNITDAMSDLAVDLGHPNVQVDPSSIVAGAPLVWPVDGTTTYLDILNELAALVGFRSVYCDNAGTLRARTAPDLSTASADFTYRTSSDPGRMIAAGTITERDDLLSAPNRYIVVDTSPQDAPIVGVYDVPDSSPLSAANRGIVVPQVHDVQGLENTAAAEAMAAAKAKEDASTFRWVEFDAVPDPRHDTYNIVAYEDDDGDVLVYREQSWTLPCAPTALMHHSLRRVYDQ